MAQTFSYQHAFARNLGWVTPAEQSVLKEKRIAIAGLGGVGGFHLLTLARLGVGAFHIADFDTFDIANFNRQIGANMSTLGLPKVEVLEAMARDINPELQIASFPTGVDEVNMSSFSRVSTCMSTAWISSPSARARPPSPPAPGSAFRPSRPRRSAWARPCSISCREG